MPKQYNSLEDVHSFVLSMKGESNSIYHFHIEFKLSVSDLVGNTHDLYDVQRQAKDWSNDSPSHSLYFNHGQYINESFPALVEELKEKSSTNRAVLSLAGEGANIPLDDNPFPSFLLMQFNIDDATQSLYVTAYFRAIELNNFLRINLAELKIYAERIISSLPRIETVQFAIFSAHAYFAENFSCLYKPELYTLRPLKLFDLMGSNIGDFTKLLEEVKNSRTVIELDQFENMKDYIDKARPEDVFIQRVSSELLECARKLAECRKKNSHGVKVEKLHQLFSSNIDKLVSALNSKGN
jgi:hypothetical protein